MKRILFLVLILNISVIFYGQISVIPTYASINIGDSVELNASGAEYFIWSPADGLSNDFGPTTMASPETTTIYTVSGLDVSTTELVVNGDFTQGNTGFTSAYEYTNDLNPEGTYYVGEDAYEYHSGFQGTGHGDSGGNFMIVNGATTPGINVWTEQISISPDTYYAFSAWLCNVSGAGTPARLQFSINGSQLGEIFSCANEVNVWNEFYVLWYSGDSETATISILNQNTEGGGNDFGLDDISFRELELIGEAQSTIAIQPPYVEYPDNIGTANCLYMPGTYTWSIDVGWSSSSIVSDLIIPLVGDLDNDGCPEIVCFSKEGQTLVPPYKADQILVFDGVTKQVKSTLNLPSPVSANDAAPYGLIKTSSGKGLIVVACYDFKLRAYDITASNPDTPYWVSDSDYGTSTGDWAVNLSFADFNHDGHPEVFVRNKIYNAETGSLLAVATGGSNKALSYCNNTWKLSTPIAADVCHYGSLQLVLGNEIYRVNITNPNGTDGNSITLMRQITPPDGVPDDGNPQVADFNADGYLDVFISVRDTDDDQGTVYGYVWDVHDDMVSEPFIINTSSTGKSIPVISDINNDRLLEVIIQCGVKDVDKKFQAYRYNPDTRKFGLIWRVATDSDSYSNGITAFDFNQDGLLELVMCDKSGIKIVNCNGIIMCSMAISETTIMQYPVVVDVDNDGYAEILSVGDDKLNIIESAGSYWAPARKVWNQYMYNVTNVNKDLTITQYQFDNSTGFEDPKDVVRYPYNNFLQQASTIDQYGRPIFAGADAALDELELEYNDDNVLLKVTYSNDGDNILSAPFYITAFADEYGGNILKTHTVSEALLTEQTKTESIELDKNGLCSNSSIVVAINCAGSGIAQNDDNQPECDTINNLLSIDVETVIDTTYLNESTCKPIVWYGQELTEAGDYEHTLTNIYGCDSLLVLHLDWVIDTTRIDTIVCKSFNWYGQELTEPGDYEHTLTNINGCDSLLILHLEFDDYSDMEIQGLTQIAMASDLWPGIYNYYIADSVELQGCDVTWECSNADWVVLPTDNIYQFKLIANTLGSATLTAVAECDDGCGAVASIDINASYIDVAEIEDNPVAVYPNPAKDVITVKGEQLKQISIYNCYGQLLDDIRLNSESEITIDTENMSDGLYFIDITTAGFKITKRIIVSK